MKHRIRLHDNWETPKYILDLIREKYGEFYDPCPLDADFDGLQKDWKPLNYVNPPYSRQLKEAFIEKAYKESLKGNTSIMLLPVSTSTKIFHNIIKPNAEIVFLEGRVKFKGHNTKGEYVENRTGQHDSMLVIFKGKEKGCF